MAAESKSYDLVIIGGGPAGYVAAVRASQLGMKVGCIEKRKTLGGTCLNVGCIPSKALLDSSEHFLHARTKLSKHGVKVGDVTLDLNAMMERKNGVVRQLTNGVAGLFKKHKVDWLQGAGELQKKDGDTFVIKVKGDAGEELVRTGRVLLATGSEPVELPFMKFDGKRIISSTEVLTLPEVPKHLIVVGGGYIGLEMSSVWIRLGAKVTVVEFLDRILPLTDSQIANELFKSLKKQGLEFRLSTRCLGAEVTAKGVTVKVEDGDKKQDTIEGDYVLVCTGRRPYTAGLGLENVGLVPDAKSGRILINDRFQTQVPGISAVGDIVDGPMLAHKAEEEGVAAVENMSGLKGHVNYHAIPSVIYTWPEVSAVGYTEDELKKKGTAYKVGTFPFMANARAKAMDEVEGMVKIIADATSGEVLGVHIFGARASDMIAEAVSVIEFGGTWEDIAMSSHAHPTLSEAMKEAALTVDKRPLNI